MKLQQLSDKALHERTISLVQAERSQVIAILHHLKENDRRKLYSDYKCSSLFDYSVRVLGLSESSAFRRIVAARFIGRHPEVEAQIQKGQLTLTNLAQVHQFLRENAIRNPNDQKAILKSVENLSKKECEKRLFELSGKKIPVKEMEQRISKDQHKVTIVVSDETLDEIKKLKALLGTGLSMDELLKYMAVAAIEKVEKHKFKLVNSPRVKALSPVKVKRVASSELKREIYQRDKKKCVICGSLHNLNYDHIKPFALGGETSIENLRLLCFNCNQRARIKVFGQMNSDRGS